MQTERVAEEADQWEDCLARSFVPLDVERISNAFTGRIRETAIAGGARVSTVRCGASQLQRSARNAAADSEPFIFFVTHRSGQAGVDQDGRQMLQTPGQSVVYVTNRPYRLHFTSTIEERVLGVPTRMLSTRPSQLQRLTARSLHGGTAGRVLQACLNELASAEEEPVQILTGLTRTAVELLDLLLAAQIGDHLPRSRDVVAAAARQFIVEHAQDPTLTPEDVAEAVGVSRRTLYNAMETASAPPTDFIRRERCARAADLLSSGSLTLTAVAHRSGFNDVRTLHRAFNSVYGVSPGVYRKRGAGSAARTGDSGPMV